MATPGDPALRPQETSVVAAATDAMEEELERMSACAVVACLCSDRNDVEPRTIKKAFCTKLGVLVKDIKVTHHWPKDFLIVFEH
jgi:hypothetical protein